MTSNHLSLDADPASTHEVRKLEVKSPLLSCRFDPTGNFVYAGAEDFKVHRWNLQTDKQSELDCESWARGIAFHSSANQTFVAGYDGRITQWDCSSEPAKLIRDWEAHKGWVRALALSPDDKLLATVGNDLAVRLWDINSSSLVREMVEHKHHIYNVLFHPSGSNLITADLHCELFDWEVSSGKKLRSWKAEPLYKYDKGFKADIGGVRSMQFSADGSTLGCSGITEVSNAFACVGHPAVVLFDWKTSKQKIKQLSKGKLRGVGWGLALHPKGWTIAASGGPGGGFLLFWEHDKEQEFHQIKLPNTARDLAASPDGIHLATAHHDGRIRLHKMAPKT